LSGSIPSRRRRRSSSRSGARGGREPATDYFTVDSAGRPAWLEPAKWPTVSDLELAERAERKRQEEVAKRSRDQLMARPARSLQLSDLRGARDYRMTLKEAAAYLERDWGGELAVSDGHLDIRVRVGPDDAGKAARPQLVAACETLIVAEDAAAPAPSRATEARICAQPYHLVGHGGPPPGWLARPTLRAGGDDVTASIARRSSGPIVAQTSSAPPCVTEISRSPNGPETVSVSGIWRPAS
jgi:hypothetical protein